MPSFTVRVEVITKKAIVEVSATDEKAACDKAQEKVRSGAVQMSACCNERFTCVGIASGRKRRPHVKVEE